MKDTKRYQQSIIAVLMIISVLAFGRYLYRQVLPYYFSQQAQLPPEDQTGEYDFEQQRGEFARVQVDSQLVADTTSSDQVLGVADDQVKRHIEVDLTNQMLYAVEDGQRVAEFMVSTGKWGRTPTGSFKIWIKYRYTKMSGGSKALGTYYYLPNVPFTMYFYNSEIPKSRGYGIHGAYWHSNFGQVMSHGCINMRIRDVEKLYYWAGPDAGEKSTINASEENPGTEIIIYGEAPQT